jgi:hypothetical protein
MVKLAVVITRVTAEALPKPRQSWSIVLSMANSAHRMADTNPPGAHFSLDSWLNLGYT